MKDFFIEINGRPIFIRQYHDEYDMSKPTLLFLHEALGSVSQWRDIPLKLTEKTHFNIYAYDRLGHGLSGRIQAQRQTDYLHREAWDILPSVLEQLAIQNPILWGHSDGGSIALLYAARFKTKALITEAAHVFVEKITLEGIEKALLQKDFLIERLTRYHGDKTTELFSAWSDTWLQESFKNWNLETEIADIICPSLIIQGENDEYGSEEQVDKILRGIGKNAQKLIISGCGHTPHKQAQEIVLSNVLNFLTHHV